MILPVDVMATLTAVVLWMLVISLALLGMVASWAGIAYIVKKLKWEIKKWE